MDIDENEGKAQEVDENLYSRQLYVYGHEAQKKMQTSNVLVVGMNGLGVEIAKNIILSGVKSCTVLDDGKAALRDLSANFYLTADDVGQPRGASVVGRLKELNTRCDVKLCDQKLEDAIKSKQYQVAVMVNIPLKDQLALSKLCRESGCHFISSSVNGVFGTCFVDLGKGFKVSDTNGEPADAGIVTKISIEDGVGTVYIDDSERHQLQTNDVVTLTELKGMSSLEGKNFKVKVIGPYSFSIGELKDVKADEVCTGGGYAQIKQPASFDFAPLAEALAKPEFVYTDYSKDPMQHHILMQALGKYQEKNMDLPRPDSVDDAKEVVEFAKAIGKDLKVEVKDDMILNLARCSRAIISPMCALFGGIVGQEILKACSGKFMPVKQFCHFDAAECLPSNVKISDFTPQKSRYDDNIAVFGKDIQMEVANLKYFLVGSGAIGCEMLKNWAMMGLGAGKNGEIIVTDMDQIEVSNLSRQFLFRTKDVGSLKSTCAAAAVKAMNPDLTVDAKAIRVGSETENVFNPVFWSSLGGICTALDNVQARLYVDAKCVEFRKAMLESGTLGTKGNTQIVVPHITESYGATRDPPAKTIPICTLKHFPNKIEHTIQWARDDFEGVFTQVPEEIKAFLAASTAQEYFTSSEENSQDHFSNLKKLDEELVENWATSFNDCVTYATMKFTNDFDHSIQQLLHNFPKDQVTREGAPFWSGTKRAPDPISFNCKEKMHLEYVGSLAILRAQVLGVEIPKGTDLEKIAEIAASVKIPKFAPKEIKIPANDEEAKDMDTDDVDDEDDEQEKLQDRLTAWRKKTTDPAALAKAIAPLEFEKDLDIPFPDHLDFVTAASNLRASNYRIPTESKHRTKRIAGNIIPAIATTTALVTGLICLELYKVIQDKKIEAYRSAFVNLALPLFTMSEPFPAQAVKSKKLGKEWNWTQWDSIVVDQGDMILKDFIEYFGKTYGVEVEIISSGVSMLYATFNNSKKNKARLEMKITDVVRQITKKDIPNNYINLELSLVDEDDNELDYPTVKYVFKK